MEASQPPVDLSVSGDVATITLQTPENRNALSVRLRRALAECLDAAAADDAARVVVLTGAGPVFCAGADLKEAGQPEPRGVPSLPSLLDRLMGSRKPVVAVLNGPARAGGIGLVAGCDVAIAPESATFAFTEVRIGVIPAIISVPCLARMSPRAAARYFLTGEVFGASDAVACGLLTAAAPGAALGALRDTIVDGIRQGAPGALAGAKRLLAEVPGLPRETAFALTERLSTAFFASDDAAEGRAAFVEKRPPRWAS